MKLNHFAFEVSDLNASIRFYVDLLGFKLKTTFTDNDEHETLALLELEGGLLELIQVLNEDNCPQPFDPVPLRPHFLPHIALETDDFEQTLQHIHKHQLKLVRGPLEIPGLVKWLYICDPDNNVIEFFQEFGTPEE